MNCQNWELFDDYENINCNENHQEEEDEEDVSLKKILAFSIGLGLPGSFLVIFVYLIYKHADLRQYLKLKMTQNATRIRSFFTRVENMESVSISEFEYQSIGTIMENSWPLRDLTESINLPERRWGGYLPKRDDKLYPRAQENHSQVSDPEIWIPPFQDQTIPEFSDPIRYSPDLSQPIWTPPFRGQAILDFADPFWNPPFRSCDLSFGSSFVSDSVEIDNTNHDTVSMICETPKRPRRQARDRVNKRFDGFVLESP